MQAFQRGEDNKNILDDCSFLDDEKEYVGRLFSPFACGDDFAIIANKEWFRKSQLTQFYADHSYSS